MWGGDYAPRNARRAGKLQSKASELFASFIYLD
jgi:hypothetical protein